MKTIWIYVKAFGIVLSRRFKRAMEKKQNVMIVLGVVSILLLCVGGTCFLRTLTEMNALGASASNRVASQSETETQSSDINKTEQELQTVENRTTQPQQIVMEEIQNLAEEKVPLAVRPGNEVEELKKWNLLQPLESEATSVLQSKSGKSYDAINLLDGDETTTWQEGEKGDGIGATLTFRFPEKSKLCGISVVNGNGTNEEKYQSNNRVKEIMVIVGNQKVSYTLEDHMGIQYIAIQEEIPCEEISIQINSVYQGTKYDDTSLSELNFFKY